MDNEVRNVRQRRKRKKIVILLIVIGILIMGSISTGIHFFKKDVAEAKSVTETLNMIGKNNPINIMITIKIQEIEETKAKEIAEEAREKLREKERLEAERKANNEKSDKIAYLTFDDGPSETVTPLILDILEEYDIKATFFVLGNMASRYPEILKRTFNEGHAIGNHSYSHDYGYIYKNTKNFLNDFNRTQDILKEILGEEFDTRMIRFPGGSFGKHKAIMRKAAVESGYTYYDWNSLNGDAEGLNRTKAQLVNRLKETSRNKKNIIILMHDTDAKMTTAESLREILDYLIAEGYSFDVLSENYQ